MNDFMSILIMCCVVMWCRFGVVWNVGKVIHEQEDTLDKIKSHEGFVNKRTL